MKQFFAVAGVATLILVGASGIARADMVARYECTATGTPVTDAVGDQPAHILSAVQFTCVGVDGLLKGATYTAFANSEWFGQNGTYITGGGVHRISGGIAVQQLIDGTGTATAPGQYEASGTGTIKLASGSLAGLAGKTLKWKSKSTGVGRSILEMSN